MNNKDKKAGSIMLQGTGSSVGKSLICTGLCRVFKQDGYKVAPFKSQNMALNSFVTKDGGEIGRAQAMQAEAAGIEPSVEMNPILLKPSADTDAQVIVNGKDLGNMSAVKYHYSKEKLSLMIKEVYNNLASRNDIVVIEGAGSPAEINLKENDIVNMGMAKIADASVVLVGDIDKGGVFASLAGTMLLLTEEEKARVKGVVINKFRGDVSLLTPGLKMLEDIIKVPVLGVLPYIRLNLDDEDGHLDERFSGKYSDDKTETDIVVVRLPHISNYTDFNALDNIPGVRVRYVDKLNQLGKPDLLILPGSKSTIADFKAIRNEGFDIAIKMLHAEGVPIFGICGGFQMLGREIADPLGLEGEASVIEGLGLLDMKTTFSEEKVTTRVSGFVTESKGILEGLEGSVVNGYEIHMGITDFSDSCVPVITINSVLGKSCEKPGGVSNKEGSVFGTYIHGIFDDGSFAKGLVNNLRKGKGLKPLNQSWTSYKDFKDKEFDRLADMIRANLDMKAIYDIVKGDI